MKKLFLSILVLALPLLASAYDCQVDGIYYKLKKSAKTAEVTYQLYESSSHSYMSDYSGSVTIPEKFTNEGVEYSVTSISYFAFSGCNNLISVTIPNSVLSIGNRAFQDCCGLTNITIPSSVTSIGGGAFNGCIGMTSITIPNSVTTIGNQAFAGCTSLTSVTIPNSVISLGEYTFAGCTSLTSVTIPNSVSRIESHTFSGCKSLTSVSIPNSVTSIEWDAFQGCSSLTSVTIPNSVASIGKHAFDHCSGLTSVTIPNSVTSIGEYAFFHCSSLTSVNIPNSVTSIGDYTFSICSSLTSVTIPNSVTSIGDHAFSSCSSLTSVTIPNSVNYIGTQAFTNCRVLTSIQVEDGNRVYDSRDNCNAIIETNTNSLITGCKNTVIPNSVTSIGDYAFCGRSGLTTVTIPNSVTSIGENAFQYCAGIKEVFCYAEDVPAAYTNTFGSYNDMILYVPAESLNDYKTTVPWSEFGKILPLGGYEYALTYMVDGEMYSSYTLKEGDPIIPVEVPSKEGYTFSGWSEIPETMPASDVTVTGTFTVNKYKLTYMVDGEEYKASEVDYGTAISAEAVPTKEGYTFSGWSEIPSTMPASDVTITGSFTINKYKLTYTLDGEEYKTAEVDYGTAITAEAIPTKEGYTFSGWSEIPKTMPASDVTITGSFTINKYKLTYTLDGKEYKTAEVDYGTALTPEDAPTKEGYTFSGWSEIPETMPANDVTVTGTFTANKYKLTYMVDGEEYKASEVDYGTAISAEAVPTKEGYTFSGWSEIPKTMPASDVTITGSFTINKYKLTYTLDGKEYKTAEVDYGTALTPEDAPTKEGYTFSGWSEIPETMPANDVTVTGTFTANKYKLTYMVDGEEYKASEVDYGTAITAEAVPTKEGYTFSGWSEIPSTMPASDVTISGTFTINKYKLTYTVDGKVFKSSEVEFGSTITAEDNPTKEGYTFSGWSEIPETMPANDVTITGTFTVNKYKLTYMVDGIEYKFYEVEYGATITPEASPANEGQTFSGWSEIPTTMPAQDVVITGTFSDNSYKLTYMVDGEVFKSSHVEYGSTITPENPPTKEGYTFSGWSEIPETMPASDVTIIGSFTVNKYNLTYKVDGVDYKTTQIEYGSAITPEAIPTKEGYTFSGWSDIPETMPASDVTITGTFNINKYKLTYMVDGVEYKSYEVEFGASITPEASPANEGQTFSGWSEIPATMPANDVVVTGTFSDNSYKLTYMVDGEVFKSSHVEYGSTITPETLPTKEGYTFSGWSEIPATMPAGDVTITGTFTINTYTITYMVDNALLMTEEVTYGSTITPPSSPKEGYEITWNSHPTTMPAYDVTIYGSYISTGINGLYAEESDKKIYTPDGKRIQSPKKGMNIIRMSDGTVKKVVVK